jgi:hypothetical protein
MSGFAESGSQPPGLLKSGNFLTSSVTFAEDAAPENLFIYALFNDALYISEYTASNGRMISKQSIGKDIGKNGHDLIEVLF